MTDRRRRAASSDSSSREEREENPFAPPPEGQPDQPWQPRHQGGHGSDGGSNGGRDGDSDGGEGSDSGSNGDSPAGWGSKWSSKQPGRQSGGFGGGSGSGQGGQGGQGNGGGLGGPGSGSGSGPGATRGMRWDPTDPLQRHARYALHAGIWGLFFALLGVPYVALLLGALSLYWGIHALRGKKDGTSDGGGSGRRRGQVRATAEDVAGTSRTDDEDGSGTGSGSDTAETSTVSTGQGQIKLSVTPEQAAKAQKTAAISGLVTASLTLVMVVSTFTFQMVYSDYYTCKEDALTKSSREECKQDLPEQIRPILENRP